MEKEFRGELFLPDLMVDPEFVLQDNTSFTGLPPQETYTAATTIRQQTSTGGHEIVTGSRTIIDDGLLWSNSLLMLLLLFECVSKVLAEYRVSLKISKCHLISDIFECVGRDILQHRNTTARSKYDLVHNWEHVK